MLYCSSIHSSTSSELYLVADGSLGEGGKAAEETVAWLLVCMFVCRN